MAGAMLVWDGLGPGIFHLYNYPLSCRIFVSLRTFGILWLSLPPDIVLKSRVTDTCAQVWIGTKVRFPTPAEITSRAAARSDMKFLGGPAQRGSSGGFDPTSLGLDRGFGLVYAI